MRALTDLKDLQLFINKTKVNLQLLREVKTELIHGVTLLIKANYESYQSRWQRETLRRPNFA